DEAIKISNNFNDMILRFNILSEKDPEQALKEAESILKEAKEKNYEKILPELYNNIGLLLWGKDDYIEYFKKALEESKKLNDLENYVLALQNLAYVEMERGKNNVAMDYLMEALKSVEEVAKKLPKSRKKEFISSYSDLFDQAASLAMDMEDVELAMEIAKKTNIT
ncbi:MAG: tetratricopeptide repeat protein, partial [Thermoplasmata archaeon]